VPTLLCWDVCVLVSYSLHAGTLLIQRPAARLPEVTSCDHDFWPIRLQPLTHTLVRWNDPARTNGGPEQAWVSSPC